MNANSSHVAQSESKPFNPYHKWLGIRDSQTPPHHYRLLGVELWEDDEDVIREAYSRQMNHVRHFWTGPHRDACQQLLDELLSARDTLLDHQLRRPYDRWLKLTLNEAALEGRPTTGTGQPFSVHTAGPASAIAAVAPEVECPKCGTNNSSSRKYCAGCGVLLWEPCIECAVPCGPGDLHCGACGVPLAAATQRRIEEFQKCLQQAQQLHDRQEYDETIEMLEVAMLRDHPRLVTLRQRAEQLITTSRGEIDRLKELAETALPDADNLKKQGEFERAILHIQQLPPRFQSEPLQRMLEELRELQVESLTLTTEIQLAINEKQLDGVLEKVERLLSLQPNHKKALVLRDRLRAMQDKKNTAGRDRLCKLAMAEIQSYRYSAAEKLLAEIPPKYRTPEITKTYEKVAHRAAEISWLKHDLSHAPIFDEHLLPLAQRLLKLQPDDARAKQFLQLLQPQAALTPAERSAKNIAWPRLPANTQWGCPVEVLQQFNHIDAAETQTAFASNVCNYSVATGLALQAIGKAALNTNLLPDEKRGLFDRLVAKRRNVTSAWGIDIGQSVLKAVKLVLDPQTGRPKIIDSALIPLEAQPVAEPANYFDSARALLGTFLERTQLEAAAVCVGFPTQKTITRIFELPPVDDKKISEIMQFEVKQQIPIPLEMVAWDYQIMDSAQTAESDNQPSNHLAALIGAKLEDVQSLLAPFQEREIKIEAVQSDCAALFNLLSHEQFFLPQAASPAGERSAVVAMLDLGASSSNILITDGQTLYMRSIPLGGNNFTRTIAREFAFDWPQAEKLKRTPTAAPWLHRLYAALNLNFQQLTAEIRQSIDHFLPQDSERTLHKMFVVGEGWKFHGLLKCLITGL